MRRSSHSHRILIISAALLGLAACTERPTQLREKTLRPGSTPAFAVAADAPAFDFGTLGGLNARATSVNDSGAVVGFSFDTSGYMRAFLWKPTTGMRDLHINHGPVYVLATDINNKGQVVGYVDSVIYARAFIRSSAGTITWLPTLGGLSSYAHGINENGDVVGSSQTVTGVSRAFIWNASTGMRDLGTLGGPECAANHSVAYDLNDQRQVVGFSCSDAGSERAFLWTETGGIVSLGTLGGPYSSRAHDINNSGQVVGVSQTNQGTDHAFLWTQSAGMRDLGTLEGNKSIARSINEAGEIAGESYTADNTVHHGFLWTEAAGMRQLLDLGGSGGAYGINQSGQVVGWSLNGAGVDRATGWGFSAPPPPPVNQPPVADAGGPYAGVEGSAIAFSGGATDPDGDQLAFKWWFGDGDSASTANASHSYADNGSFNAVLRAVDPSGASHVATAAVSITNVAPRVIAGQTPATIYSGDTLYLNASFSDPGTLDGPWTTTIDWADGPAKTGGTGNQSTPITGAHRYFRAASYSVRVSVTDKDNGIGADTVALEVARFPTTIDVAPKDASNVISIRSGGQTLSVVLLGTVIYDAHVADPASAVITNGPGSGTRLRGTVLGRDYERTDVNKDGRVDVVLYFYKNDMVANGDLTTATTKLVLLADDTSGRQTRGENTVTVKP